MSTEAQPSLAEMVQQDPMVRGAEANIGQKLARLGLVGLAMIGVAGFNEQAAESAQPEIATACLSDHTVNFRFSIPGPNVDSPVNLSIALDGDRYTGGTPAFPAGRYYTGDYKTHTTKFSTGHVDVTFPNDPSADRHATISAMNCEAPVAAPTTTEAPAPPPTTAAPTTTEAPAPTTTQRAPVVSPTTTISRPVQPSTTSAAKARPSQPTTSQAPQHTGSEAPRTTTSIEHSSPITSETTETTESGNDVVVLGTTSTTTPLADAAKMQREQSNEQKDSSTSDHGLLAILGLAGAVGVGTMYGFRRKIFTKSPRPQPLS